MLPERKAIGRTNDEFVEVRLREGECRNLRARARDLQPPASRPPTQVRMRALRRFAARLGAPALATELLSGTGGALLRQFVSLSAGA